MKNHLKLWLNGEIVAIKSQNSPYLHSEFLVKMISLFDFRVLGSLLSAHLIIKDPLQPFGDMMPSDYDDELLLLAHDVANRLLGAFELSKTKIPYARVSVQVEFSIKNITNNNNYY